MKSESNENDSVLCIMRNCVRFNLWHVIYFL